MKKLLTILFLLIFAQANSQEFVNGDLSGIIIDDYSLPTNWLGVPNGDINCVASVPFSATADLTNYTQPSIDEGVIGNPYSGDTFVSGIFSNFLGIMYQEGIMQTVSGFILGNSYPINFHQAVVKQMNCLDSTGSWAVYVDDVLAGISVPTYSSEPFNSTSFPWELRTISFLASAKTHTIKFLPIDDDASYMAQTNSGIRMGIDCIYIADACLAANEVNDYSVKNYFEIYPNPVLDKLNIEYYDNESNEIIIYDLSFRKILQQTFRNTTTIDTEQLATGTYLYELRNINGIIRKGKVIKQ